MATRKTVNTEAMLQAAESGQRGVREQAERREQSSQHSREMALREGESLAQNIQTHRQQTEQERSNLAREDLQGQELQEQSRSNQMREAIAQDEQDIGMADRGVEAQGPSRADRLRQEMERGAQQRFSKAADQDLEISGPEQRTVAQTEERKAQDASKLVTGRLNAQANYLNAARSLQEARLKGDTGGVDRELKNLSQPIKSAAKIFDDGKKGDLAENQWENLKQMAAEVPDPTLQDEISRQEFGPRLAAFVQNKVAESSLRYMAISGDMPDGDLVDMGSPMMQQFTSAANQMQGFLRMADQGGLLSMGLGITSMADRNRMVRKLTAQAMLQHMANPAAQAQGSVIPSQGGAGARQQHERAGQLPGSSVGGKVGLTDIPAGKDPNRRTGSPVQQALGEREQRTIDEQSAADRESRRVLPKGWLSKGQK